ncbi:uncharacterized protein LOC129586027 [Paramacrobiotus metropolitanus]|uniref:uncharacterized protein LOC129586027 n=1 Tax=Paramacrobiotus metropolitanus TaxID=2943436 RepID=UPI0024463FF3|nr:uncharacterized protein LOC129586027 [Paramacrobiotus metropolitanus]
MLLIADLDEPVIGTDTSFDEITSFHGTIHYQPLEMLKRLVIHSQDNIAVSGRKADIWSLGCVILELGGSVLKNDEKWLEKSDSGQYEKILAGSSMTRVEYMLKRLDGFVPFVSGLIPGYLTSCIRRCLSPDSEQRPLAKQLLLHLEEADKELVVIIKSHQKSQFSKVLMQSSEPLTGAFQPLLCESFGTQVFLPWFHPIQSEVTVTGDLSHIRGSVRYMSPEMIKFAGLETRNVGRKTDIWSLGCILLKLAQLTVSTDRNGYLRRTDIF